MTTANYKKGQEINNELITALYCRLSVEDLKAEKIGKKDESNSISNHDVMYRGWNTPKNITS